MKRNYYSYLLASVIVVLLSCSKGTIDEDAQLNGSTKSAFTIDDAQEFFENNRLTTSKSTKSVGVRGVDPGDFTPQWDRAVVSQDDVSYIIEVPIIAEHRHSASLYGTPNVETKPISVEVSQKLVISRVKSSNQTTEHILSLIPSPGESPQSSVGERCQSSDPNCSCKFSGLAILSSIDENYAIQVERYLNGVEVERVPMLDGRSELESNQAKMQELMGGVALRKLGLTRSVYSICGEPDCGMWGGNFCSMCYRLTPCSQCLNGLGTCRCCRICGAWYTEDCDCFCEKCKSEYCSGECCDKCGKPDCYGCGCTKCYALNCAGDCSPCIWCNANECNGLWCVCRWCAGHCGGACACPICNVVVCNKSHICSSCGLQCDGRECMHHFYCEDGWCPGCISVPGYEQSVIFGVIKEL